MNSQPAIEFQHVTHSFDADVVLKDINFSVGYGEMAVILGGSGSGKSTILRLALGLIQPDEGRIYIEGEEITSLSERELFTLRQKMGMIFQGGALFDSASVYENVGYKLIEAGWQDERIEEEARRQLAFIDFKGNLDDRPADLSGGMRRVVAIARAMVGNPRIVFFDEPTAGLDPPTAKLLCELAAKYRDLREAASIFVTHRMDDVKFLSSVLYLPGRDSQVQMLHNDVQPFSLINTRFMILRDARIYFSGTDEQMRQCKDPYVQEFIGMLEVQEEESLTF